ncbi:MAG: hypothetical protein IJY98_07815, partial [Bacteroidaceae bacterium]|nr:hypothetical protein [Bacteroidaceae bacterium]
VARSAGCEQQALSTYVRQYSLRATSAAFALRASKLSLAHLHELSHNGLPPAGLSAVSLTVPVSFLELPLQEIIRYTKGSVREHNLLKNQFVHTKFLPSRLKP